MEDMKLCLPINLMAMREPWAMRQAANECVDTQVYAYLSAFVFAALGLAALIGIEADGWREGYTHGEFSMLYFVLALSTMMFIGVGRMAKKDARVLVREANRMAIEQEQFRRREHEAFQKKLSDDSAEFLRKSKEDHEKFMTSIGMSGGAK